MRRAVAADSPRISRSTFCERRHQDKLSTGVRNELRRRAEPLVPGAQRAGYERFVRAVFTGRGGALDRILAGATGIGAGRVRGVLRHHGIDARALPRDLTAEQWATLWNAMPR